MLRRRRTVSMRLFASFCTALLLYTSSESLTSAQSTAPFSPSDLSYQRGDSVLGIAQHSGLLALFVASRVEGGDSIPPTYHIDVYREDGGGVGSASQLSSLLEIPLPQLSGLAHLLDLQFGDATSVHFCTEDACGVCHLFNLASDSRLSHCSHFRLPYGLRTVRGAYAAHRGQLFLRGIGSASQNASIFSYTVQGAKLDSTTPTAKLMATAADNHRAFSEQELVSSFIHGGHVFFVGSATRIDIPFKIRTQTMQKRMDVRLTRVCLEDGTRELESRIDIALSCKGLDLNYDQRNPHSALAASVSADGSRLLVAMLNGTLNIANQAVCEFDIGALNAVADETWDTCQSVENRQNQFYKCQENNGADKACYIVSWASSRREPLCTRYSHGASPFVLGNCELASTNATTERSGWLENFNYSYLGEVVAVFEWSTPAVVSVVESPNEPSTLFVSFADGRLERRRKGVGTAPLWTSRSAVVVAANSSLARLSAHSLFYVAADDESVVHAVGLNCAGLYSLCNSTGIWDDPLKCGWCAELDGRGHTMQYGNTSECRRGQQLREVCPPVLERVFDDGKGTVTLIGQRLDILSNPTINHCGVQCIVNGQNDQKSNVIICNPSGAHHTSAEEESSVNSTSGERVAIQCDTVVTGRLGGLDNFTLVRSSTVQGVIDGARDGSHTRSIRVAAALLVIFLLAIALGVIWRVYKKYSDRINDKLNSGANGQKNFHQDNHHRLSYKYLLSTEQPVLFPADELHDTRPGLYSLGGGDFHRSTLKKIQSRDVTFVRPIGEGHSSKVHLAIYHPKSDNSSGGSEEQRYVAVKTVTNSDFDSEDILREIELISKCAHDNIVEYVGDYTTGFGIHIVTEFMAGGDLHKFLLDESNKLTIGNAFSFILQICEGMNYLTHMHIVHRDLAARNCMLDENCTLVKITDFGLCRVSNTDYEYVSANGAQQLPFRWTALECFGGESRFSEKSDVWSFAVVVWEVFARNIVPYEGVANSAGLREFLVAGGRLPHVQPELTPKELYENVMLRCWDVVPANRPTFAELRSTILEMYYFLASQRPADLETEYETPIRSTEHSPEDWHDGGEGTIAPLTESVLVRR